MTTHPREALSAYADGELPPGEAAAVEAHLEVCTECLRELAIIRNLGGAMKDLRAEPARRSVWEDVHRRITRPVGWVLLAAGALIWAGLITVRWFRQELTLVWVAGTAIGVGLLMLALGIAYEQYREWKGSPYKDLER
jgi:anti-sigma factor RsiW